jgi:uncharacterized phage protein gp47/JayE
VTASVTIKDGYAIGDAALLNNLTTAVSDYFSKISYEKRTVAYMNIGAIILGVDGVESVSDLRVNCSVKNTNGTEDISLEQEEIPVLSSSSWTVN